MLIPLILSGGSGTRLWPVSRKNLPKQFLALAGNGTLFQQTIARTLELPDVVGPIVVASEDHRFLAADQLLEAGVEGATIVLEPLARNTAPTVCSRLRSASARMPYLRWITSPCSVTRSTPATAPRGDDIKAGVMRAPPRLAEPPRP